jgi:hypothetical protein
MDRKCRRTKEFDIKIGKAGLEQSVLVWLLNQLSNEVPRRYAELKTERDPLDERNFVFFLRHRDSANVLHYRRRHHG